MDTWNDEDGLTWISCDLLAYGDYSGSGTIGQANVEYLVKELDARGEDYQIHDGAYHHKQMWLQDTLDNRELIEKLERDYPLISDEEHSRVEMEWEEEAWNNWLKDDLIRALPDDLGEIVEDDLDDSELYQLYRDAMEKQNEYPIFEQSGCTVRRDRIQETFNQLVIAELIKKGDMTR